MSVDAADAKWGGADPTPTMAFVAFLVEHTDVLRDPTGPIIVDKYEVKVEVEAPLSGWKRVVVSAWVQS